MLMTMLLALTLSSPDLKDGAMIPKAFVWNKDGCDGENRTPRVTWSAPPPGTKSFLLLVSDHDAPTKMGWTHWNVFSIPGSARGVGPVLPPGTVVHTNDFGTLGWGGPCPPPGQVHHYTFWLHARGAHGTTLATARMTPVYKSLRAGAAAQWWVANSAGRVSSSISRSSLCASSAWRIPGGCTTHEPDSSSTRPTPS
jgi:Raf kinase inhibitor-like YbhB/YbcL family protein